MEKRKREVEIKYDISNLYFRVIEKIRTLNAIYKGGCKETTIRFDTKDFALEKNNIFLRVRSGFKNTITLKEKNEEDVYVKSRIETEFEIEDIEQMKYLLSRIGFDYLRIMEKYRMIWEYKGASITVDELPFGIFIEIEADSDLIVLIASELGLSDMKRIVDTYWDLFHDECKRLNLIAESIIFPSDHKYKLIMC